MKSYPDLEDVYLEIGSKKTFACAIDWPGWSRSARDETGALVSLLDYGARYACALEGTELAFRPPVDVVAFVVAERLKGDASTDFGAPGAVPDADRRSVDEAELDRFRAVLEACWQAFDAAAAAADGKDLRRGPRGGGRDQAKIVEHVLGADAAYLSSVGWKLKTAGDDDSGDQLKRTRQAILDALDALVGGELPTRGPRGGVYWPPRYFVRRVAWHVLDHAWEIEDRVTGDGASP